MRLLSIDPGTRRLGWAIWEASETPKPLLVSVGAVDGLRGSGHRRRHASPVHRLAEIVTALDVTFDQERFDFIAYEKPPFIAGRPNASLLILAQSLDYWIRKDKMALAIHVFPTSVKAYVRRFGASCEDLTTVSGKLWNPSKAEIQTYVRQSWVPEGDLGEDEADAVVIGLVAMSKISTQEDTCQKK